PPSRRVASLVPYALVTLAWRVAYARLGYGSSGSSLYVDPIAEPLRFIALVPERWLVLAQAQLVGPPSDLWMYLAPHRSMLLAIALVLLGASAWVLAPLLRHDPRARFFACGPGPSLAPLR